MFNSIWSKGGMVLVLALMLVTVGCSGQSQSGLQMDSPPDPASSAGQHAPGDAARTVSVWLAPDDGASNPASLSVIFYADEELTMEQLEEMQFAISLVFAARENDVELPMPRMRRLSRNGLAGLFELSWPASEMPVGDYLFGFRQVPPWAMIKTPEARLLRDGEDVRIRVSIGGSARLTRIEWCPKGSGRQAFVIKYSELVDIGRTPDPARAVTILRGGKAQDCATVSIDDGIYVLCQALDDAAIITFAVDERVTDRHGSPLAHAEDRQITLPFDASGSDGNFACRELFAL